MTSDATTLAALTDEKRYQLLIDAITDFAIYMLDRRGFVSSWNPGAQRFKGYTESEIIGENFERFYTEEDRRAGKPKLALETAAREGRFEAEGRRVRKDGSEFWASVVIDAIHDPSGHVIGFAKITRDISERKHAEDVLNQAKEALFQTQKLEAIGQLTGGVAHDFNNLLMVVLSNLELLRKRLPADAEMISLLDNSLAGARRGVTLTQRMLAFARRQELAPRPTALPALLHGLSPMLEQSIGAGIDLEYHFPAGLPMVTVDPHQLENGLLNLIVNSRDAMPDGGLITISARRETVEQDSPLGLEPGNYATLSVTDDGKGMDEETVRRAVEPFFTTKGVGKGTGLGLSMVQGLCAQSGGTLEIRSSPGRGTTMTLWLRATAPAAVPVDPVKAEPPKVPPAARTLNILVVDDDPLVLMGTSAMLDDLGHTAIEASSGEAALAILRNTPRIDLVISDQAMPHMTGVQLAERIAAEWPALPVVIATGYAQLPPGTSIDLPRLSKPFAQKDLEDLLRSMAGRVPAMS